MKVNNSRPLKHNVYSIVYITILEYMCTCVHVLSCISCMCTCTYFHMHIIHVHVFLFCTDSLTVGEGVNSRSLHVIQYRWAIGC